MTARATNDTPDLAMKKIAYLTWGNGSQIRSFQDYAAWLDDLLYLGALDRHDLRDYACVVLPDDMDPEALAPYAPALNAYLRAGGFVVSFIGRHIVDLIDVVDIEWLPIDTRDWKWWMKPGGRLEIYQPEPAHPICKSIPLKDMAWHWFGVFALRDDAISALNLDGDEGSLFLDFPKLAGGGRLIVSTLDPHLHNGERFMPATTRFLNGFYPWLNRELGIDRSPGEFSCTYLQTTHYESERRPIELERSFQGTPGKLDFRPGRALSAEGLAGTDILYIPNNQDQFFLRQKQDVLLGFLERGGHLVINSEPAIAWLPFLKPFQAVPPRPFDNIRVRVRNDPFGFFRNMDADFDGWEGVFGQYARGWSPMPEHAMWLTDVGPKDDPRPADWLWKYPTDDGKGGYVFMHNGDNMYRYPDHGPGKELLVRDICAGLMLAAAGGTERRGFRANGEQSEATRRA